MSTYDDDGEVSFEQHAEREINAAGRKVVLIQGLKPLLVMLVYFGLVLTRLYLAFRAVLLLDSLVVTLAAIVIYPGRWLWGLVQVLRTVRSPDFKAKAQANRELLPEEAQAQRDQEMQELMRKRPYRSPRSFLNLIFALGSSTLAGIYVGHLANGPLGVLVGMAFFILSVAEPFLMRKQTLRMQRVTQLFSPGPKDTPEI